MTQRGSYMRISLYGCSHRPRVSAMVSPKKGDTYYCATCKRKRVVMGAITTWAYATVHCDSCTFEIKNLGKHNRTWLMSNALRHANARQHHVVILHDGEEIVVRPEPDEQLPLIDDLFLP